MPLPRLLTALVGIPALVFLIHWGGLTFTGFVIVVAALSLYEYGLILRLGGRACQRVLAVVAGAGVAGAQALGAPAGAVAAAVLAALMLREMASASHSLDRVALTLLGVMLLGWMPAYLALLRDLRPFGERLTLMLFVTVWVMDTAAYVVGRTLGRHPLAPLLSPRKTWEGAIAGFSAAAGCVFAFRAGRPEMLTAPKAWLVAGVIGIGGQLSDLAESLVKRAVGVKDSGPLLPGHGGVMDRFDSFLLTAPALYYCLVLL